MRSHYALAVLLVAAAGCGGDDEPTGDTGTPSRQVAISATDALRFDPATITATAGEKITFVITNTGKTDHEFVIGGPDYQAAHGSGGGHAHGAGDGASAEVKAGQVARVTFTMPSEAPTYACHVDNHDDAGMTGQVTYGSSYEPY